MRQRLKAWWAENYRTVILMFALKTAIKVGVVLLLFNRCSSDKNAGIIDFGYDYFPVEIGHYVTYSLDSITYDDFFTPIKVDTSYWDVKEFFHSTFTDQLDRPSVRIERYMKSRDSVDWVLKDVWAVTLTNAWAEKVEESQRYMKLVFPARVGQVWNGNQFILPIDDLKYLSNWQYRITNAVASENIGGTLYDNVLTVLQRDEETAISKTFSVEKFARGIGMVYKELWVLESQTGIGNPWPGRAEKGFIIRQTITGYGQE